MAVAAAAPGEPWRAAGAAAGIENAVAHRPLRSSALQEPRVVCVETACDQQLLVGRLDSTGDFPARPDRQKVGSGAPKAAPRSSP